jgi:hypothetical protein
MTMLLVLTLFGASSKRPATLAFVRRTAAHEFTRGVFARHLHNPVCRADPRARRRPVLYRYSSAGRGAGSGVWGTSWAGLYLGLCDVGIPIGAPRRIGVFQRELFELVKRSHPCRVCVPLLFLRAALSGDGARTRLGRACTQSHTRALRCPGPPARHHISLRSRYPVSARSRQS